MSWNPVLNKFIEIKKAFVNKFGKGILWNYDKDKECCLEYWARLLRDEETNKILSLLRLAENDGLLLFHYTDWWDKGETPFWDRYDGFYRECRSVTIDIFKDELVHVPFRKFFNLGETDEYSKEQIEEKILNAKVIEFSNKLDGSMTSARYYNGRIILASSQSVNTESSWRLTNMYEMFYKKDGYKHLAKDFPRKTFIYEYISQKDAKVVNYSKEQEGLYLIGIRDVDTGEEASYAEVFSLAKQYDIPTTVVYETSLDKVLASLGTKKSNEAEGFVVNIDGFKVKIKYDDYVMMHRAINKASSPNMTIQAIADGKFDDFLSKIPTNYKERVIEIADKVFSYIRLMEDAISVAYMDAPKENKAHFGMWMQKNTPKLLHGYLIARYDGKPYNVLLKGKSQNASYLTMTDIEKNIVAAERFLNERTLEKEER